MKIMKLNTGVIEFFRPDDTTLYNLPVLGNVKAGFPSPADDFIEFTIDLNKELIKHKDSTFFARVNGHSMKNVGIFDGDLLVIDKSLEPKHNSIAICQIDGEFTCKRISIDRDCIWLVPENDEFEAIKVTEDNEFIIWGIVKHSIKSF